jgi:hypothetical protein
MERSALPLLDPLSFVSTCFAQLLTQYIVEREKRRAAEAAEAKAKKKTVVLRPDDSWLTKTDSPPPPIPAKSPLRSLFAGVHSTSESKRFSSTEGYFESSKAEEQAHKDLTPPALRIIQRREQIEARLSSDSISHTPPEYYRSPSKVPNYYEDISVPVRNRTIRPTESEPTLRQLTIHQLLSAQSLSDIPTPDDPEEAKCLEKAWTIKQRKISFNRLEDLPADHGLTELFARFRIPSEQH